MRNHEIIGRLLQLLRQGLEPTVKRNFPDESTADVYLLLRLFAYELNSFREDIPRKVRTYSHELREVRNEWAHQKPFSDDDTLRAIDSGERLIKELGELVIAKKIAEIKSLIRSVSGAAEDSMPVDTRPRVFRVAPSKQSPSSSPPDDSPSIGRPLKDLQFTLPDDSVAYQRLKSRLDAITHQVLGSSNIMKGRYPRRVMPLNFDWAREARIQPAKIGSEAAIQIVFHLGDTKGQAEHLFELNPNGIEWPSSINGFQLTYNPYLRVGNAFGSTLFWIRPTLEESKRTHTLSFFKKSAGKHKRDDWHRFDELVSAYLLEWKTKCFESDTTRAISWDKILLSSNRNEFSLSIGMNILVSMPFEKCQELDDEENSSGLAYAIREVINSIKAIVEKNFSTSL